MTKGDTLLARLDEKTKYIVEKVDDIHQTFKDAQESNVKRLEALERWRSWINGGYAVGATLITALYVIVFK